jgi:ABC-type multidrug transport system fused ATPase/permease subunit
MIVVALVVALLLLLLLGVGTTSVVLALTTAVALPVVVLLLLLLVVGGRLVVVVLAPLVSPLLPLVLLVLLGRGRGGARRAAARFDVQLSAVEARAREHVGGERDRRLVTECDETKVGRAAAAVLCFGDRHPVHWAHLRDRIFVLDASLGG